MKMILVSKCFLNIEQYVEFKMSVLIFPSKSSLARIGSQMTEIRRETSHAIGP